MVFVSGGSSPETRGISPGTCRDCGQLFPYTSATAAGPARGSFPRFTGTMSETAAHNYDYADNKERI